MIEKIERVGIKLESRAYNSVTPRLWNLPLFNTRSNLLDGELDNKTIYRGAKV